jgi:predicted transposase/invertase (TIGR01784 family)
MPLGIRPTVDFVFKMLFGSPANADLLIHLLNAVLQPDDPIVEVEILNPFNEKEFEADKLSVVDVKARDGSGRWFVIEMQTSLPVGIHNRLVYYTSGLYYGQLLEGEGYDDLRPAISICFLTETLFRDVVAGHLRFELHDPLHQVSLGDQLQLHFVELPKYDLDDESIGQADLLKQWVFFLDRADDYDAKSLQRLLPDSAFQKATGVLEVISRSPELRLLYDDRAKAELDQFSALKGARDEGRQEGRQEGQLIGRIRLLQQLLGDVETDAPTLSSFGVSKLERMASDLEQRLNDRN